MDLIKIELTPIDIEAFKLFQKHYVAFKMLDSIGAFNTGNVTIEIHFNAKGEIVSIDKMERFRL